MAETAASQQTETTRTKTLSDRDTAKKKRTPAQLRQQNMRRRRFFRAGIQAFFFLTMPGAFVAGFTGVKHLFQWIGTGEVLQMDSFVCALIGLAVFTILFGRWFCGFACAFGGLGDFVYWLSGLVQTKLLHRKKQFRLPEQIVRRGQTVKYLLLAVIVLLCCLGLYDKLTGWSPWDVFSRLTALKLPADGYVVGIILLLLILAGMAVQPRFFCQFLCPMGAVFSILPVLPWSDLERGEQCIPGYSICEKQCPVALKLDGAGNRGGECIACEACVAACPRKNISRWDVKLAGKYFWIPGLIRAVLFFALGVGLGLCRFF